MHMIILSEAQLVLYETGHWDAWAIEETCLELAERYQATEPVIVVDLAQRVLFALTPQRGGRR